jgi:hypothetical protein
MMELDDSDSESPLPGKPLSCLPTTYLEIGGVTSHINDQCATSKAVILLDKLKANNTHRFPHKPLVTAPAGIDKKGPLQRSEEESKLDNYYVPKAKTSKDIKKQKPVTVSHR